MKTTTYWIKCKTCNGKGIVVPPNTGYTIASELCPVCEGSKIQLITETES